MVQFIFGHDKIIPNKHKVYWEIINKKIWNNITKITSVKICSSRLKLQGWQDSKDKNKAGYKSETPYKGPYVITHMWNNGTVALKTGEMTIIYHILQTQTCIHKTNVDNVHL